MALTYKTVKKLKLIATKMQYDRLLCVFILWDIITVPSDYPYNYK